MRGIRITTMESSRSAVQGGFCIGPRKAMYRGSPISPAIRWIMWCEVMCPLPKLLQAQSTSSLSRVGTWIKHTQEHSTEVTSGSRCQTMSISICHCFPTSIFSCEALLQYLVYLVLFIIIFFRLINYDIRTKTSACINHISLTTFALV